MKKYKIQECLQALNVMQYRRVMKALPKITGKSMNTLWNYINIELDSKQDIPNAVVVKLEKLFELLPGELSNEVFDVPSYTELHEPPEAK